jgi:hypothetical protein
LKTFLSPYLFDQPAVEINGGLFLQRTRELWRVPSCGARGHSLALAFFAAFARFFCFGLGLVLPLVPREIFPRFVR